MSGNGTDPTPDRFKVKAVSTGEEFQDKLEDDLYEKKDEPSKDPAFDKWMSRIAWIAVVGTLLWFLFLACYAGWRWVS